MVGVREPVRARARRRDDRVLVEREGSVARRRPAASTSAIASAPLAYAAAWRAAVAHTRGRRRPRPRRGEELGAVAARAADLEVRRAGPAHRAAAEQRPAEVRAAAARAADHPLRRRLERRGARDEDARLGAARCSERGRRPGRGAGTASPGRTRAGGRCGSRPRRRSARSSPNARRATAGSATSRWTENSPAPRRCRLPAVWKRPESSASRSQSRRGAIAASSRRTSSESGTLELQQPALVVDAERPVASRSRRRRRPDGRARRSAGAGSARRSPGRRAGACGRPASAASSP